MQRKPFEPTSDGGEVPSEVWAKLWLAKVTVIAMTSAATKRE
ncbi:MAG: hypothetical protein R3E58_04160 [Phycisphaerae bacterium]